MRRLLLALSRALPLLAFVLPAFGCSSSPAATNGDAGGGDAGGPVSFQTDLLPRFTSSCGLSSSCHQQPVTDPATQRVFLGCTGPACPVTSPGPQVYAGLMAKSRENLSMPYVHPGDPTTSYLLYKLEGTQGMLDSQCVPVAMDPIVMGASGEPQPVRPCGASMPLGAPPLGELSTMVRAWIEAGAPND